MAVPTEITVPTLKGSWTLDSSVTEGMDDVLKLQGVGWLTRKAINTATVTLKFTSTPETSASGAPTTRLTMNQSLTGGIGASTEERIMDWTERERSNHIYGDTLTKSQFIKGIKKDDGSIVPELSLQSKPASKEQEEQIVKFLTGGKPHVTGETEDELKDLYIHDFGRNEKAGWTAEQVWGLEDIGSQQYLTRRVVVVKGDTFEKAHMVYKFSGL
ncbi:hypothetical protein BJX96DRAFT_171624 [Aspergillus floccosus]